MDRHQCDEQGHRGDRFGDPGCVRQQAVGSVQCAVCSGHPERSRRVHLSLKPGSLQDHCLIVGVRTEPATREASIANKPVGQPATHNSHPISFFILYFAGLTGNV